MLPEYTPQECPVCSHLSVSFIIGSNGACMYSCTSDSCYNTWERLSTNKIEPAIKTTYRVALISDQSLEIEAHNMTYEDGVFNFWEDNKIFLCLTRHEVRSIVNTAHLKSITQH